MSICLVVDAALEVVEEYQAKILKIEQDVLLKPSIDTVRRRASFSPPTCLAPASLRARSSAHPPR